MKRRKLSRDKMHQEYRGILERAVRAGVQWIWDNPPYGIGLIEWQFGGGAEEATAKALTELFKFPEESLAEMEILVKRRKGKTDGTPQKVERILDPKR